MSDEELPAEEALDLAGAGHDAFVPFVTASTPRLRFGRFTLRLVVLTI